MTQEQVLNKIREMVAVEGSQAAVAKKLGVTTSYLNDVLWGRRKPGKSILDAMGIESRLVYTPRSRQAKVS